MDCAISTMAQSTTVITVTEVTIKNRQPAFFAPPKQQSLRNAMYPPSTILFTSMGSVCWWQRKKLWEAHLSTANNFAPSHLGLPQNMAVEMRVMKIWTIYFQTVLLEFLGKEAYLLACARSLNVPPIDPAKLRKIFTNKCTMAKAKRNQSALWANSWSEQTN